MRDKVENKFCWYGDEAVNRIVNDFLFVQILKRVKKSICGTKIANFIDSRKAKRF